jgi:hypothetical protein
MSIIVEFKKIRIVKSWKSFIKIKPMKLFVDSTFFLIPLEAPIHADYCFTHSRLYNNVYQKQEKSQAFIVALLHSELIFVNPEIVLSKERLYDKIWGEDTFGDLKTVTVHIKQLREKIKDDPANPWHIQTVWGSGYRFTV